MAQKGWRNFRLSLEWGAVLACVIALIGGAGTLLAESIVALVILGGSAAAIAVFEHGWHHAPSPIGTPIKVLLLLAVIWVPMAGLGHYAWPRTTNQSVPAGPKAETTESKPQTRASTAPQEIPNPAKATPSATQPIQPPTQRHRKSDGSLEVLDFDSIQGITLHNGYGDTVVVLGIVSTLSAPQSFSTSSTQEMEISPSHTEQFKFSDPGNSFRISTVRPLASTWEGQVSESE